MGNWSAVVDNKSTNADPFRFASSANANLFFDVNVVDREIIRFKLFETNPKRYDGPAQEVLSPNLASAGAVVRRGNGNSFAFGNQLLHAKIETSPFKLTVYSDQKPLVELNRFGLLNFELLKAKKDSSFEERELNTFVDKKAHGLSSIGIDVTFPQATTLNGIPIHADSLALRETRASAATTTTTTTKQKIDPYRLYNLDVFGYPLQSTTSICKQDL
jgi:alpha 1,3-glucosidase